MSGNASEDVAAAGKSIDIVVHADPASCASTVGQLLVLADACLVAEETLARHVQGTEEQFGGLSGIVYRQSTMLLGLAAHRTGGRSRKLADGLAALATGMAEVQRLMDDAAAALDRTFRALADPNRRAILSVVRDHRCAVGEIANVLGLSQQIVSHHLKVLGSAGLVTGTRSGTRHLFAVRSEGLAVGKEFFDDFWPERLNALKRAVESSKGSVDG